MHDEFLKNLSGTILVVDDTSANLRLLIKILSEQGHKVRPAPSGSLALNSARSAPPDLVLLDIKMPDMDGYTVCQALKADDRTRDVPVIFISALNDVFDKMKAFSLGAVDYITKPFQQEEVLARVHTHLTIRRQQQQIQAQNAVLEAQSTEALELNAKLQEEIYERQRIHEELIKANQELQRLASLDGLTRIANRRRFDEYLAFEWKRLAREQLPLSVILGDIDDFKRYNDTYGHLAGDECLKQVAQGITRVIKRPADLVARYGGEEFVVILPNTEMEGAQHLAQAIQTEIQQLQLPHAESSVSEYVTISLGVSTTIPSPASLSDALLDRADSALYEAKAQGKNRIIFKSLPSSSSA
ncbi:diguanylate cyclase [candidate division KSB3 bacterium]|uniref:Diguanylate cyclase n=1 Tax=candidate division KSB3 bacterium TaxID=2044937 RepID=A0A9D5Q7B9_9BACT|nr:diguanylate cyclase [candidate division KSB3 bacterium]MBD3326715.1 diguanylate cyclase [candidate division KSB3 bacterium]